MTQNLSLNLTIHNKAYLLPTVLASIRDLTVGLYELIFVVDGCTDSSLQIVEEFCKQNPFIKTKIIESPNVFETKANNLALKQSNGDISIIIQDDVIINERGWNKRLIKPFTEFSDVFGVTGNTAHNWELNSNSIDIKNNIIHGDRWCDILNHVHHANKRNLPRDVFAIRDCINRAPLAIKMDDMQSLGYFDEEFAPQDMDDHDLCFRMQKKLGKKVGCYWIDWYSKPEYGGTRDENGTPKRWLLEAQNKNTRLILARHRDALMTQSIEHRILK